MGYLSTLIATLALATPAVPIEQPPTGEIRVHVIDEALAQKCGEPDVYFFSARVYVKKEYEPYTGEDVEWNYNKNRDVWDDRYLRTHTFRCVGDERSAEFNSLVTPGENLGLQVRVESLHNGRTIELENCIDDAVWFKYPNNVLPKK